MLLPASQLKKHCKCGNPVRPGVYKITRKGITKFYANFTCTECSRLKNKKYNERKKARRAKKEKPEIKLCAHCGLNPVRKGQVKSHYKKKDGTISFYQHSRCIDCYPLKYINYYQNKKLKTNATNTTLSTNPTIVHSSSART